MSPTSDPPPPVASRTTGPTSANVYGTDTLTESASPDLSFVTIVIVASAGLMRGGL